ncbi:stalk domain-containing protein [Paenibacillus sp.]|uniref:stalk domain-containing protein n=1 Tax=Paenibacillus sp. TaxID=58172 RepID=UPI002D31AA29|nr:stalk domain-containing protein [Paenibacillus sp.]HZG87964.1 stalk domain-containing protein [Paenibacillus sp.]
MKPYAGKIVVSGIVASILLPLLLYLEFQHGFYQTFRFEQQAERYLAAAYDEEMTIAAVRYAWDNIEPLVATAHPTSDPSLRFYLFPAKDRDSGVADDYAPTLWKKQATKEVETLLQPVQQEYASNASVEFSCCKVGEYDFASIRGQIPHYGTTGIPFDLVVDLKRPMAEADLNAMYRAVAALRESASLVLDNLAFRFTSPKTGSIVSFQIPGDGLHAIASPGDVESYNATRLPAQDIAKRIGASLQWNEETNEADFIRDGTTLTVRSWGNEAMLNGTPIHDPVGAYIGDAMELMVPLRLIERTFKEKIALW